MRATSPPSPAVIVGIDGSSEAVAAALWAIDEAVERDLPLRLLYAIEPQGSPAVAGNRSLSHDFVTAEAAIRHASMAVESTDRPVKLEIAIVQARAVDALVEASTSAALICVGALGINDVGGKSKGSVAAAVLAKARCPVAIVRKARPSLRESRPIVVELDDAVACPETLSQAVAEARLRSAPLRVLSAQGSRGGDAPTPLESQLDRWRRTEPGLDIRAVEDDAGEYLARHGESIQLVVRGVRPGQTIREPSAADRGAVLDTLTCPVLFSGSDAQ
ncbi:universal stress protein [Mycolicibacterium sp. 050158]|uniref:universal stress protein n=1 Tax=Mycolicibacterium sp. 050158 TaxID=3090602 RepID=UPI00299D250E|nr:universal stress protein [Mycolicibacterium sp. 050158]MDX1890738.1 universal stress protein [Mycolicibacterium sp. 050158]